MSPVKLTYFNVTGLGEPIRFLLSYSEIDFIDNRLQRDKWSDIKPTINCPYGQLPILEIDGHLLWQSVAICRYLAKKANLVGDNEWESYLIDATVDSITDLRLAASKYVYASDPAVKSKIHDELKKETIPFYVGKFEKQVIENNGYFVSGKLTWADLYFVALLDTFILIIKQDIIENYPKLQDLKNAVYSIPTIKAWIERRPVDPIL